MDRPYQQLADGEWVRPRMQGFKFACCNCGLIHDMDFKIRKAGNRNVVLFRATQNLEETEKRRRFLQRLEERRITRSVGDGTNSS